MPVAAKGNQRQPLVDVLLVIKEDSCSAKAQTGSS